MKDSIGLSTLGQDLASGFNDLSLQARACGSRSQSWLIRELSELIDETPRALLPDNLGALASAELERLIEEEAFETAIFRIAGRLPMMVSCNGRSGYMFTTLMGSDGEEYTASGDTLALAAIAAIAEGIALNANRNWRTSMPGCKEVADKLN